MGGRAVRTLVIGDVHGNLAALEAVLVEPHDLLLCLGDLVGFGPEPGECVRRVRDLARIVVQGDHDRRAAFGIPTADRGHLRWLADATAAAAVGRLGERERAYLGGLPRWAVTSEPGPRCLLVHGAPADALYGELAAGAETSPAELAGVAADLVWCGQTHRQFQAAIGATRVVSPGSVGLPLDGDSRAAYAVLDGDQVWLRRVPYPIERTIAVVRRAGLPAPARRALERVLWSGAAPLDEPLAGTRS